MTGAGDGMNGASDKAALRRHFRRRRRDSRNEVQEALLAVACEALPPLVPQGRSLGLYWPVGSEPDLRPLADLLADRLALPAIIPRQGAAAPGMHAAQRLVYRSWRPGQELVGDACGIPAPSRGAPLEPGALGLIVVPALAVDRTGLRLGSGGGWYDRLRGDRAWRAVPALAVLPCVCVVPSLPRDSWDVPFDGWIDEQGLHMISNVASS